MLLVSLGSGVLPSIAFSLCAYIVWPQRLAACARQHTLWSCSQTGLDVVRVLLRSIDPGVWPSIMILSVHVVQLDHLLVCA